MRTTVDLPDDLMRALKIKAARRGETLKDVLTRAVSREVSMGRGEQSRVELPLISSPEGPVVTVTSDDIATALADDDAHYAR